MGITARFTVAVLGATLLSTTTAQAAPDTSTNSLSAGATIEPSIDCAPTAAHPYPVVVLPGADGSPEQTETQWATMAAALREAGYCTLVFQGGIANDKRWNGDMPGEAKQVGDFVAKVRQTTGADRVEIVAHSAGTIVSNYYLKVLAGAPTVSHAVFITPEIRGCDGAGILGVKNPPVTPVQLLTGMPFLEPVLAAASPDLAVAMQMMPDAPTYKAIFDTPVAQPGVTYSVIATRNDQLATPAPACSTLDEPGVVNAVYEDLFPGADPVDHSLIRSTTNTAGWVLQQLQR
ncbi:esterase/lipase family protein [Nocardia sp. NPDC059240]|uniref:esterase/lipase family protein n=1 Tax=Nocardia sp. NPDC059240 TaxID=3346786 RepID=UPI00369C1828